MLLATAFMRQPDLAKAARSKGNADGRLVPSRRKSRRERSFLAA